MFPIRWDYLPKGYHPDSRKESLSFDERTKLSDLTAKLENTAWKRVFYRIENDPLQYNELTYFHAYTTQSIFDLQQRDEQDEHVVGACKTLVYFEIPANENDYYLIETTARGNFELRVKGLSLHAYNTGVAIITINLENWKYPDSQEVLCINDMGRRIYPQFLGGQQPYTNLTKGKVLAACIELKCSGINNGLPVREDFTKYDDLAGKETHKIDPTTGKYKYNCIIEFPDHIKALFNNDFVYNANDESDGNKIRFNILTDDRMFFQCWYGNNQISGTVKNDITYYNESKGHLFAHCKFWYAFMYGDQDAGSLGLANKYFMEKEILANTYDRWVEYGSLYGFTRDSFVAISSDEKTLIEYGAPQLRQHIKTIYYQMAVLCLAQRAGVLRFSAEVASITQLGKTFEKEALDRIQQLYLNYIEFINTLCFREVTPQMQGIEIYSQFRKAMNIPEDVKNLDAEIQELHNFAMFAEQKRAADKAERLSLIATIFLPAGVVIGLMSMSAFDKESMRFGEKPLLGAWLWIITGIILSALISVFLVKWKSIVKLKRSKK